MKYTEDVPEFSIEFALIYTVMEKNLEYSEAVVQVFNFNIASAFKNLCMENWSCVNFPLKGAVR